MYLSTKPDDCKHDSGVSDEDISDNCDDKSEEKQKALKHGNLEYAKLWEELKYTGKGLDELFEESKNSAFEIKRTYDYIHQLTTINEALRLKYYEALSNKKKFDEERDEYFKSDAELAKKKDEFIEENQTHALQHSRYVEYSKRFSKRREEYITRLLTDVEKYYDQVETLARDKHELRMELAEQRQEILSLRQEVKRKTDLQERTSEECTKAAKEMEKYKKEIQWMNRQNEKLKEIEIRLEQDKEKFLLREKHMSEEIQNQIRNVKDLSTQRQMWKDRWNQLNQRLKSAEDEFEKERQLREEDNNKHKIEMRKVEESMALLQTQKKELRESNRKTLQRLEKLRKNYEHVKFKKSRIEKAKNIVVSTEFNTQGKNVELAEKQLELIDEVLMLKKTFCHDQERIRRGGKQYIRLERKLDAAKLQMEILKENPSVVDPLEFSQEHRETIARKFVHPSAMKSPVETIATFYNTALKNHVPVIGQIPEPKRKISAQTKSSSVKHISDEPSVLFMSQQSGLKHSPHSNASTRKI